MPYSGAETYLKFLTEFNIKPEELRAMPIYDVFMIQYAQIAKYINETEGKDESEYKSSTDMENELFSKG